MTICKLSNNTCISWLQKSALRVSLLITPPWSQQNQAATKYWKYRARCKLQVCDCSVHVQEKQKTTHRTFRWILSEFRIHLQMFVVCYFFLCTLSTCDVTFFSFHIHNSLLTICNVLFFHQNSSCIIFCNIFTCVPVECFNDDKDPMTNFSCLLIHFQENSSPRLIAE